MTSQPRLLTTLEVAERLVLNPETIRRWVKAGRLEPVPLPGRNYRFREEDIEALCQKRGVA